MDDQSEHTCMCTNIKSQNSVFVEFAIWCSIFFYFNTLLKIALANSALYCINSRNKFNLVLAQLCGIQPIAC